MWAGRTSAQSTEVLCSLWHSLAKETHHNAAQGLAINLNVEEHLGGDLGALSVEKSYKMGEHRGEEGCARDKISFSVCANLFWHSLTRLGAACTHAASSTTTAATTATRPSAIVWIWVVSCNCLGNKHTGGKLGDGGCDVDVGPKSSDRCRRMF